MKNKVGLVLEGGGMRAIYTAGVLDYFLENKIEFKYIVGVSAGVACGLNYVSRQVGRQKEIAQKSAHDKNVVGIQCWLKTRSYFNLEYLYNELPKQIYFDQETFAKSPVKFLAGCFNVETGKVDYFDKDDMVKSIKPIIATSSLPLLSKMVTIKGHKYLDGGIKESIPIDQSMRDGNNKNVVILTNPVGYRKTKEPMLAFIKIMYRKYPKLIEALKKRHLVYNKTIEHVERMQKDGDVLVIRPSVDLGISRYSTDDDILEKAYEQGKKDAAKMSDQIKKFIK